MNSTSNSLINSQRFDFLASFPVQLVCRLILAGTFIYASLDKITHPHAFAKIISNYQLLPAVLITLPALILPWLEMVSGIFLLAGIYKRASALILTSLLLVFSIAISINLIRGISFDCGCFTTVSTASGSDPVGLLIRDLLLLIPGLIIIFFSPTKQPAAPGGPAGSQTFEKV